MSTRLYNLSIEHIAGVDRPANKRKFLIIKQEKKGTTTMLTKEQVAKIQDKDLQLAVVEQQEQMADMEKKLQKAGEDIEALKKGDKPADDKLTDDELWKGAHPAARNRFESLLKERDAYMKKAKEEKDEREEHEHIGKCEAFKHLQITPRHFGKIMKTVAESSPESADEIYRVLHQADGLIEKGAFFSEIGKTKGQRSVIIGDATNITARVDALAHEFMQIAKSEGKELTQADAITKVFNEHPDWHTEWRRSQTQRVGNSAH